MKIVYPTANTKRVRLVVRTRQLAPPEGAESLTNIKSHALVTRCGVPQPLLGQPKPGIQCSERWWRPDFKLITNQNIIIPASHSQLVQIAMKTMNNRIEDPNPAIRNWSWISLDIATNNQQQATFPEWPHRPHSEGRTFAAASLVICSPHCTVQYVEIREYCPV